MEEYVHEALHKALSGLLDIQDAIELLKNNDESCEILEFAVLILYRYVRSEDVTNEQLIKVVLEELNTKLHTKCG
jgi:hypothetical protein